MKSTLFFILQPEFCVQIIIWGKIRVSPRHYRNQFFSVKKWFSIVAKLLMIGRNGLALLVDISHCCGSFGFGIFVALLHILVYLWLFCLFLYICGSFCIFWYICGSFAYSCIFVALFVYSGIFVALLGRQYWLSLSDNFTIGSRHTFWFSKVKY